MEKLSVVSIQDLFEAIEHEGYSFHQLILLFREWRKARGKREKVIYLSDFRPAA